MKKNVLTLHFVTEQELERVKTDYLEKIAGVTTIKDSVGKPALFDEYDTIADNPQNAFVLVGRHVATNEKGEHLWAIGFDTRA